MAVTPIVVDKPPFILTKPKLLIGDPGTTEVEYECGANEIQAEPEQDSNDTETFCGTFTSYKPAKWTITVTAIQSFGDNGLWNNLRPFVNTIQPFTVIPDGTVPISTDNIAMTGLAYIPEFAYLTAPVGEASEFDFVLAVQGDPDFIEVPPVGAVAAATPGTPKLNTPTQTTQTTTQTTTEQAPPTEPTA